jgi:putative ABC transport system permease protein
MAGNLGNLLRYLSIRHLMFHRLRTLLGFFAVALGVALYVSAEVANTSVVTALEDSGRELAGRAEWQVMRGHALGIETAMLAKVRAIEGAVAAPVIQTSAAMVAPAKASLLLLGVDFASDAMLRLWRGTDAAAAPIDAAAVFATLTTPNAILLARPLAERLGVERGTAVTLDTRAGRQQFVVTGLLELEGPVRAVGGDLGVIGIGPAARLFRREGIVDRIDVAGASLEALHAACPGCVVEPARRLEPLVEDSLARLRSLVAISLIAVLVGIFIVYNTVAVAVVERFKEIGTLRAIGATRGEIQRTLLVEWAIVGALGSVAGVAGGWLLAKLLVDFTAESFNVLAQVVHVRAIVIEPMTVLIGLTLGLSATLAAAWFPVHRALLHPPVAILRAHDFRRRESHRSVFVLGVLCLVLGACLIWALRQWMTAGLVSTGLFFLGLALALPQLTIWIARWCRPLLARLCSVEGFLAADNIAKFPQRTALTVTALGGALAMMVASATFIESFRTASMRWLEYTLPFDLAVSSADLSRAIYGGNPFPAAIAAEVARQPCVADCYAVRASFCDANGHNVMVVAVEMAGFARAQALRPEHGSRRRFEENGILQGLLAGEGLCISDNFAHLYECRPGDTVSLATRDGQKPLRVLATVEDYSWPRGCIVVDLHTYRKLFDDTTLSYVDVVLRPGVLRDEARAQLAQALGGAYSVYMFARSDIQQIAGDALDRLMALSNVQVLIALVIGLLGIVNTLLISVLHRTREVGLLRAIGMTRAQIARTVVLEALLMATVGGGVGIALGLLGGWYPLRLFTLQMTGFWTPMVVPWSYVAAAGGLSLAIGAAAAWAPARSASRLDVLDAIGYE